MSDNQLVTIFAFFLATVLVFSISPTGNYVSNYNPASNPIAGGCVGNEGKWNCYYDAASGWYTTLCVDGRWQKQEFCGTINAFGTRACEYKRIDYRTTITQCSRPHLPEENADYGTTRGSIVYTP